MFESHANYQYILSTSIYILIVDRLATLVKQKTSQIKMIVKQLLITLLNE